MNYELAKQLKDAGFPQMEGIGNGLWYSPKTIIRRPGVTPGEVVRIKSDYAYAPTLSELIKECGDSFISISRIEDTGYFQCRGQKEFLSSEVIKTEGNTLEISAAKLWLAINNKNS